MNAKEQREMECSLGAALYAIHEERYGPIHIRLREDGAIDLSGGDPEASDILSGITSVADLFGPNWGEGIDTSDLGAVAYRVCDHAWVAEFGDAALADAKKRLSEKAG